MEITVPFSSYKYMRFVAVFAGLLGVAQSAAYLGMSVTGIVAYYCNIDFIGFASNFGTILRLTIFHMYFRGDCTPTGFPTTDFTALDDISLLSTSTVHIWMWVVAALSFLWLVSSVTLLTSVNKSAMSYSNVFIFIWTFITFAVCMVDMVLFILFIIDYETIMTRSFNVSLNFSPATNVVLLSAQNTAGMMASLAVKGYFLWIINLCMTVYLFTQTFKIYDYNRTKIRNTENATNGQVNNAYTNDEFQGHSIFKNQPIQAFDAQTQPALPWYNYLTTDIPRAHRSEAPSPQPQVMMRSKSSSNLDENFQKRMTSATATQAPKAPRTANSTNNYEARPQLRSAMRNSRYN